MRTFITYYLPVYFILFFGVAFFWRSFQVYRVTGINPYRLKEKAGPEKITGNYFRFLPILSLIVVFVYAVFPEYYSLFGPIEWLNHSTVKAVGILLMTISLVWTCVAQQQMGRSWRIGIDHEHATTLVMQGIFTLSRNPIFFGLIVNATGFFLVLPNALTMLILALNIALIQVQVSLEEVYLQDLHGEDYRQYCEKVRRWI